jgi:hypothetical protein
MTTTELAALTTDELDELECFEAEEYEIAVERARVVYDRWFRRLMKEDYAVRPEIVFTTWCNLIYLLVCDAHSLDGLIETLKDEYKCAVDLKREQDAKEEAKNTATPKPYHVR